MSIKTNPTTAQPNSEPGDSNPIRRPSLRLQFTAWLVILSCFVIFCMLAYVLIGFVGDFFSRSSQNQNANLYVSKTGQYVFVQRNGQGPQIKANPTDTVSPGDIIQTDNSTTARLELFDGTSLEIQPNSRVVLKESRIVTTNFVKREKLLTLEIGLVATEGNQPTAARVKIQPMSPNSGNFIGQPIAVYTTNGAKVIFDDTRSGGIYTINVDPQRSLVSAENSLAAAKIYAADKVLPVGAGQRVIVEQGQPPVELIARNDELIDNGGFLNGLDNWQVIQKKSIPDVKIIGDIFIDSERIDDATQTRVHIKRVPTDSNQPILDNAENSLRQTFRNASVSDYRSLELTIKLRIKRQSLAGGGESGYEYPVFVKINYIDAQGVGPREYFHGFYYRPNSVNTQTRDNAPEDNSSERLKEDEWVEFKFDLAKLRYPPARLVDITVGASGHEYEVFFNEVSLIAKG